MSRESCPHAADGFVVWKIHWLAIAVSEPVVPSAHQGVLENWKLIGIVADVVQQLIDERLADRTLADCNRSTDRFASFVAGHPWDQVLAVIDCLRQFPEL